MAQSKDTVWYPASHTPEPEKTILIATGSKVWPGLWDDGSNGKRGYYYLTLDDKTLGPLSHIYGWTEIPTMVKP